MNWVQQEHALEDHDSKSSVVEFATEEEYSKWLTSHQSR